MAGQPCNRCGGVGLCFCPNRPVSASFTDEDIQRVGDAIARAEGHKPKGPDSVYYIMAVAALNAFVGGER